MDFFVVIIKTLEVEMSSWITINPAKGKKNLWRNLLFVYNFTSPPQHIMGTIRRVHKLIINNIPTTTWRQAGLCATIPKLTMWINEEEDKLTRYHGFKVSLLMLVEHSLFVFNYLVPLQSRMLSRMLLKHEQNKIQMIWQKEFSA